MSKFAKPKAASAVTQEDIDRVIDGADAVDERKPGQRADYKVASQGTLAAELPARPEGEEVRFTLTLDSDMADQIDKARKGAGRLTRLSWIRVAIAEKLARDGA